MANRLAGTDADPGTALVEQVEHAAAQALRQRIVVVEVGCGHAGPRIEEGAIIAKRRGAHANLCHSLPAGRPGRIC